MKIASRSLFGKSLNFETVQNIASFIMPCKPTFICLAMSRNLAPIKN